MIQRIQSLYLALVALSCVLLVVMPLFTLIPAVTATDPHQYIFSFLHVLAVLDAKETLFMRNWPLMAVDLVILGVAVYAIAGFKNRRKQQQWCMMLIVLSFFLIALTLYTINTLRIAIGAAHTLHFSWAMILVIVQPILAFLARRAIRKDDALVRSADRLR
jgi:hypothetical protein